MNNTKLTAYNFQKDGTTYTFEGASYEEVVRSLDSKFSLEGYKLESGAPGNGTYGTGSTIMRLLFGAFVKRYTFSVIASEAGEQRVNLALNKGMTGISGGVIGYAKMNKEHKRISEAIKSLAPMSANDELIYNSLIANER